MESVRRGGWGCRERGKRGNSSSDCSMAVCLLVCLMRVHVFLRWHHLPCLLCPSPVLSQSRRVPVLLDTCVPVPLCPSPCVCEFHCVPVPWYADLSPFVSQSRFVPVRVCSSSTVSQFLGMQAKVPLSTSHFVSQSVCVRLPLCPSSLVCKPKSR